MVVVETEWPYPATLSDTPLRRMEPRRLRGKGYLSVGIVRKGKQYLFVIHNLVRDALVGRTDTGEHRKIAGSPGYTVTSTGEVWKWSASSLRRQREKDRATTNVREFLSIPGRHTPVDRYRVIPSTGR